MLFQLTAVKKKKPVLTVVLSSFIEYVRGITAATVTRTNQVKRLFYLESSL